MIIHRSSRNNELLSAVNVKMDNSVREVDRESYGLKDSSESDQITSEGDQIIDEDNRDVDKNNKEVLSTQPEDSVHTVADSVNSEESGYEDIKPPKPTKPADPSIPRFGKRFRFSSRHVRMQKLEAANETYYPPDHIRDGHLWNIRKELNKQESLVLESQRARVGRWLPLYDNLTAFLGLENDLDKYISSAEQKRLQTLRGESQSRYRQQLTSRMLEQKRRENRAYRDKRRKILARQVRRVEGEVCEGCSIPDGEFHFDEMVVNTIVMRKFIGNEEMKIKKHGIIGYLF